MVLLLRLLQPAMFGGSKKKEDARQFVVVGAAQSRIRGLRQPHWGFSIDSFKKFVFPLASMHMESGKISSPPWTPDFSDEQQEMIVSDFAANCVLDMAFNPEVCQSSRCCPLCVCVLRCMASNVCPVCCRTRRTRYRW